MVRMKKLLRKLHIGGGDHHLPSAVPPPIPAPATSSSSSSRGGGSAAPVRVSEPSPSSSVSSRGRPRSDDFSLFEEEYQVQLALAISVSDPDGREDPESAQINAAKKMSLGCTPVRPAGSEGREGLVEVLSQRYWSYNILNYGEKVMDGFYDVYGIIADHNPQGKMPLLVDLQVAPVSGNIDYEVVLVNRIEDEALQQLESQAVSISSQCKVAEVGPVASGLIQRIADLVVNSMGGPVDDADDMLRRWTLKSYDLRTILNSVVLPLGRLTIGLSRHRALLFKVLADRIDLPCRLVKGSYYTGTDDGAVILIKADNEREFIIDLMGAPGALIPAEIPSCYFQTAPIDIVNSSGITQNVKDLSLALGSTTNWQFDRQEDVLERNLVDSRTQRKSVLSDAGTHLGADISRNGNDLETQGSKNIETSECDSYRSRGSDAESSRWRIKVKDVPECIVSAAKNPGFARKLHAILIESGVTPPVDLLTGFYQSHDAENGGKISQEVHEVLCRENLQEDLNLNNNKIGNDATIVTRNTGDILLVDGSTEMSMNHSETSDLQYFDIARDSSGYKSQCEECSGYVEDFNAVSNGSMQPVMLDARRNIMNARQDGGIINQENLKGFEDMTSVPQETLDSSSAVLHPVLDDVSEWEIPWEDLQLGERIGLGSYGEVYHADWNGTEVAVKKFLDQELSGDALLQFRAEIKIMLRLRHPNVVLFMGAVTRPPNLSILTEFLPRGSLYRLLHRPNSRVDEKRRLRMALDVAKGMNYLHTSHPPIVHRDLKSPNLLVDKNWVVKVCDFGLSRLKHHTFLSSKSTAGTPEWMAPEVLRNERSNEKCDVYSFGVILWELATMCMPWSGMNPMQVVGAVGFQNRRLDIPNEVDPLVAEIICNCWLSEPDERPSFAQLLGPLKQLQRLVVQS